MSWAALLLRHLRGSALRWTALALVVALTSALTMAWPRWLDRTATAEVRRDLAGASAFLVDPTTVPPWLPVSVFAEADTAAEAEQAMWSLVGPPLVEFRDTLPEPLRSRLADPEYQLLLGPVEVPDGRVTDRARMSVQPALAPGLLDRAVLVEGRVPAFEPAGSYPDQQDTAGQDGEAPAVEPERLEIALSVTSAEQLRWQVGETRTPVGGYAQPAPVELTLVGTFDADDAGSSFWQHSGTLLRPTVTDDPNTGIVVTARAIVAPGYASFLAAMLAQPESSQAWFPLDPAGVTATTAALVAEQLATELTDVPLGDGTIQRFTSEAPQIIDGVLGRRAATEAVLALAVAAPAGVLLAMLALAAQVIVAPRRGALRLLRMRGAGPSQLRTLLAVEAALVCLPAAAAGALAATAALPADMPAGWWAAPVVIAAAPVASLAGGSRATPRPRLRLAAEIAVGLLAVVGLVLLGRRGVTAAGADPLAVATPLLLALGVTVVCVRVLPALLRPVARRLRRREDLVAPLGATLAERRRPSAVAAMAMVAGTSVAVLGTLTATTLTASLHLAARSDVGADLRVTGRVDAETLQKLGGIDGVAELAAIATTGTTPVRGETLDGIRINVYAVDAAALGRVQAAIPDRLVVPPAEPERTGVVVSDQVGVAVGDELELVFSTPLRVTVAATAPTAPGITGTSSWIVLDRQAFVDAGLAFPVTATYLALEPGAEVGSAVDAVREVVGEVPAIRTSQGRIEELSQAPTALALRTGLLVVAAVGLMSAAGAVALTLAGRTADRTRVVSVLRTMGLPPRAEVPLVLWEVVPTMAVSMLAGGVLGFGLVRVVLATTDLRPFTGAASQPALVVDPLALTAALGAVVVVAAAAVIVSAWAAARRSAAVVLRAGEEPS